MREKRSKPAVTATTATPSTPVPRDREAWRVQGPPWRSEPEIDAERQRLLAERRAVPPDIKGGVYPFAGSDLALTRADIEWLLATHDREHGPVDWDDVAQRGRDGLDLRGA